jgi:DNA-binding Xre family transcriptional regulator
VWPPTPAKLQTSFHTVLITLGLSRPSPWAVVAGERNSTGDFHFLKKIGASFDGFLDDEGIREQVEDIAIKRVMAFQIKAEMEKKHLTKTELAKKMHTSRSSLNRLLDPEDEAITFKTLKKAAAVLEKKLVIQLA